MTALCLRQIVKTDMGARPVIIDGAACHVNRILIKLLKEDNIECIAIVRSEQCVKEFSNELGLKYVLNCESADFF